MAPGTAGRIDAIVVDHSAGDVLGTCVRSLEAAGADRIVVVDNAVPPGASARALLASIGAASRAEVVETGANVGYGSGANRGAATSAAELILICNADVVVESGALGVLADALDAEGALAIVGPRVNEPDGTRYPSARRFPSLTESAGHALAGLVVPGNRFTRRYRMEHLGEEGSTGPGPSTKVDWVSGSCMLVRREAFEDLGGFDESYFMYGEDVDLCWRAHRAGWSVGYVPAAAVTHHGGVSTRRAPYRMLAAHHRSALRFAHRSLAGPRKALLPAVALALGARLVASVARQAAVGAFRSHAR